MILLFFQNCLSPHQIPYIRECVKDKRVEKVYFVMPRIDYGERAEMGWKNDNLLESSTIEFVLKATNKEIKQLLSVEDKDIRCFFSGIRGDIDVFRWLNISLGFNVKRYIITEPPYTFDKPLWMHYLRFFLQDYKYVKYIDGVFAIGESCEKYYNNISKHWEVWPFVYVTENNELEDIKHEGDMKVLYVGSLSKRKNVKVLIEAMEGLKNIDLTIVGDGEERANLEQLSSSKGVSANFVGTKSMKDIPEIMRGHDVLVLPSLHDGWGAVINEALTQGLYAICSDKCGAKDLLHSAKLGSVFANNNSYDLRGLLKEAASDIDGLRSERNYRKSWTRDHVDDKCVADYFIKCLTNDGHVSCPWRQ